MPRKLRQAARASELARTPHSCPSFMIGMVAVKEHITRSLFSSGKRIVNLGLFSFRIWVIILQHPQCRAFWRQQPPDLHPLAAGSALVFRYRAAVRQKPREADSRP